MMQPLTRPQTSPIPMAPTTPRNGPDTVKIIADVTEVSPAIEPTEMSSAPMMMTMVCTTASRPEMATAVPITRRFGTVKNSGFCTPITMMSSTIAMISETFCTPTAPSARRSPPLRSTGGWVTGEAAGAGVVVGVGTGVLLSMGLDCGAAGLSGRLRGGGRLLVHREREHGLLRRFAAAELAEDRAVVHDVQPIRDA